MNDSAIHPSWEEEESMEDMEQRYLRYRRDLEIGEWRDYELSKSNSNDADVASHSSTEGNSNDQKKSA